MSETGSYLYAVGRDTTVDDLHERTGVDGGAIRVVRDGDLSAVVSTVGLEEFGEQALKRNLEDLDWLERVARSHDAVVADVARLGPTAPLRILTIYYDDDGVRRRLREQREELTESLERVTGRSEWGVKAYDASPASGTPAPRAEESGAAYLKRRRDENTRHTEDAQAAAQLAERIHDLVRPLVVASRRLPPQDPRLSGRRETMTLNGTYLVDDDRATDLRELVAGLSAEHPQARIELHGPWPPYSFATLEKP